MTQPTDIRREHLRYRSLPGSLRPARTAVTSREGAVRELPPLRRQRVRRPAEHEDPRPLHLPRALPRLGRRDHRPGRHQLRPSWRRAWTRGGCGRLPPRRAGLTVVDLDNADAIAWARENLPATRTVPTTRGEHWLYRGAMQSANARPARRGHQVHHGLRPVARPRHRHHDRPAGRRARADREGTRPRSGPAAVTGARAGRGRGVPAPHAHLPGPWHRHGGAAHHRGPSRRCTPPSTGRSSPCCPRTAGAAASPTPTSRGCSPPRRPRANRPGTAPTRGPTP